MQEDESWRLELFPADGSYREGSLFWQLGLTDRVLIAVATDGQPGRL
jgi:hypothetical protein